MVVEGVKRAARVKHLTCRAYDKENTLAGLSFLCSNHSINSTYYSEQSQSTEEAHGPATEGTSVKSTYAIRSHSSLMTIFPSKLPSKFSRSTIKANPSH